MKTKDVSIHNYQPKSGDFLREALKCLYLLFVTNPLMTNRRVSFLVLAVVTCLLTCWILDMTDYIDPKGFFFFHT